MGILLSSMAKSPLAGVLFPQKKLQKRCSSSAPFKQLKNRLSCRGEKLGRQKSVEMATNIMLNEDSVKRSLVTSYFAIQGQSRRLRILGIFLPKESKLLAEGQLLIFCDSRPNVPNIWHHL